MTAIPNSGTATTGAVVGTDVLTCVDVLVGSEVATALVLVVTVGGVEDVEGCCSPKNPKTAARRVATILKIRTDSPFPRRRVSSG